MKRVKKLLVLREGKNIIGESRMQNNFGYLIFFSHDLNYCNKCKNICANPYICNNGKENKCCKCVKRKTFCFLCSLRGEK